jgi:hypothetical protein
MIIGFGLVSKFNETFLSPILAKGGGAPWCWAETSKARCPVRAVKENIPRNNVHSIFIAILSKGQVILSINKLQLEYFLFQHLHTGMYR